MSLPAAWVDSLVARLSVRYGAAFMRQYEGFDMAVVKADWADVLDRIDPESIAYALRYLPTEKPPNALQFRDICRRAPAKEVPALPAPPADPQRVAAVLQRLVKPQGRDASLAEKCAAGLRKRMADGARLTQPQRAQLEACERHLGGESIPAEELAAAKERAAVLVAQHLGGEA